MIVMDRVYNNVDCIIFYTVLLGLEILVTYSFAFLAIIFQYVKSTKQNAYNAFI